MKGVLNLRSPFMRDMQKSRRRQSADPSKEITPSEKRGESHAILRGELMAILDLAAGRRVSPKPEVIANALARPRLEPISQGHGKTGREPRLSRLGRHSKNALKNNETFLTQMIS